MLTVGIRVNGQIEVLNKVLTEVSTYKIWVSNYGDDWKVKVDEIQKSFQNLYDQREEEKKDLVIYYSFAAAQLLKRMLLHYLGRARSEVDNKTFETVSRFIMTIEDRIEDALSEGFIEFLPRVDARKMGS